MTSLHVWKSQPGSHSAGLDFVPVEPAPAARSFNAASRALPGGVYTTLRTYAGQRVLALDEHIHRLEESARLLGQPLELDRQALRRGLGQAILPFLPTDTRLRLIVDLEKQPGTVYLLVEPLQVPSATDYAEGVWAITCRLQRANPRAKQTTFIAVAEQVRQELPQGANEGLLVADDGRILEGLSSNFFALKDGILWTAGEGMLPGTARALALEAAALAEQQVRLEAVRLVDLPALSEAFITSSSRSVLPLRQIDRTAVGAGRPGPVTRAIQRAYWQLVEARLENLHFSDRHEHRI